MQFLLNLPESTLIIIMSILGGVICALHTASALGKRLLAKISQYVNIFLHICLFCLLLLSGVGIDVGVAVFMASAFIYVLISFIKHEYEKRRVRGAVIKEAKNLDV